MYNHTKNRCVLTVLETDFYSCKRCGSMLPVCRSTMSTVAQNGQTKKWLLRRNFAFLAATLGFLHQSFNCWLKLACHRGDLAHQMFLGKTKKKIKIWWYELLKIAETVFLSNLSKITIASKTSNSKINVYGMKLNKLTTVSFCFAGI